MTSRVPAATRVDAARRAALRILFVTSDKFPPFRPAAKAIFAEGLPSRGHRVDWLLQAADPAQSSGQHAYRGGIAHIAPTPTGQTRLKRLWKYCLDIRNDLRSFGLLARGGYSLVQVKDKYIGALIALIAGKIHGVPVFYWLAYPHPEASLYAAERRIARYALLYALRGRTQKWLLYRVIMPACAHVFVQSEQMRSDVAREGIARERMTPVPSSVNLGELDEAPDEPSAAPPRDQTIVYLGTLLRERQLDFLIRVLSRVLERVPAARLVLVGRGEMPADEALLHREAERLGIDDRITITGWLPIRAAWEHVRRASVCVSPYCPIPILRSTSPTKLIEYMALGKAVVANDHPEQSEVIARSGGGLICRWEEDEFADAVATLLEQPARAAEMGRAGRRFVEQHRTHATMTDLVVGRYRDVLAGPAAIARIADISVPSSGVSPE